MKFNVDASDLVRWARFFEELPRANKQAIADALNVYGEGVAKEYSQLIAEQNGWDPDAVRQNIIVSEAEPNDLTWKMDASMVTPSSEAWQRPWEDRDQSAFEQNTLVNIVTCEDGYDCKVCEEIAANGPYTMSEVIQMKSRWADYVPDTPNMAPGPITNLVHPRCRCMTMSWTSSRRLPVGMQASGNIGSRVPPQRLFSMRGLAKRVLNQMSVEIKARKARY